MSLSEWTVSGKQLFGAPTPANGFLHYGWDAEGNLITVDSDTGTFDALNRRVELGNSPTYSQVIYPPFDPTFQMGLVSSLTVAGTRFPLPDPSLFAILRKRKFALRSREGGHRSTSSR